MVPCGEREDKTFEISDRERLEMLKKTIAGSFECDLLARIFIDDIEMRHGKMIPTYNLVKMYESMYPQHSFYFVAGSDLLDSLPTWREYPQIKKEVRTIIVERKGWEITPERTHLAPDNSLFFYSWKTCKINKSSSMFRNQLKTANAVGETTADIRSFVDDTTFRHILSKKLYTCQNNPQADERSN